MIMKNMKNLIFWWVVIILSFGSSFAQLYPPTTNWDEGSSNSSSPWDVSTPSWPENRNTQDATKQEEITIPYRPWEWPINWWELQEVVVQGKDLSKTCKWIKLNTDVPFVWRCIGTTTSDKTTQLNAFPKLMWAMMRLIMTVIMVLSILMIVVAGVMMTTGGVEKGNYTKGLEIIKKVAVGIALLWASGVILKLINPNFFV